MNTTTTTIYHYIVVRYPNGALWYEGCASEAEARGRAVTSVEGATAEYVGTSLPDDVITYEHQKERALLEEDFRMQPLQGSEKQIAWARDIRSRYVRSLEERSVDLEAAKKRYQREEPERLHAKWWIDHRYALGVTTKASNYIAEGRQ